MDFFGPSLLKVSKKRRKKGSLVGDETQSSEEDVSSKETYVLSKMQAGAPYREEVIAKGNQDDKVQATASGQHGR